MHQRTSPISWAKLFITASNNIENLISVWCVPTLNQKSNQQERRPQYFKYSISKDRLKVLAKHLSKDVILWYWFCHRYGHLEFDFLKIWGVISLWNTTYMLYFIYHGFITSELKENLTLSVLSSFLNLYFIFA